MGHPSLSSVFGAYIEEEGKGKIACVFLTEECLVTLDDSIRMGLLQDAERRRQIVITLFEGLAHLHSRFLIHGRINPMNIVADAEGILKFRNFNLTRFSMLVPQSEMSEEEKKMLCWRAPEQLENVMETSTATDIFSMGLISALIFTLRDPKTVHDLQKDLDKHCLDKEDTPVVLACLRDDPVLRPSAECVVCTMVTGVKLDETAAKVVRNAEDAR
ncbi:hypothetical protein GUITHDRAFT_66398, partial [Guillardia theta CCMP2712]